MLSIHQSALISALADDHKVLLVAEHTMDADRIGTGWSVPDMGKALVIISPSEEEADKILDDYRDAVHVFSGINAYPLIYRQFKRACKQGCFILNYLETYKYLGFSGRLRCLKYTLLRLRYGRYIKGILATGNTAVQAYQAAGYHKDRIFDWGYFTEIPVTECHNFSGKNKEVSSLPDIVYVGRLDHRKRILSLVQTLKKMTGFFNKLYVIGSGPLKNELNALINSENFRSNGELSIEYCGTMENKQVQSFIANCDILVLPSVYDGWGAVVNEALIQGNPVVCSEDCGASTLLKDKWRGETFSWKKKDDLYNVLKKQLLHGKVRNELRQRIHSWAFDNLSGKKAASYLVEIVNYVKKSGPKPTAPWLKEEK